MDYVLISLISFIGGGLCVFLALEKRRRTVEQLKTEQEQLADGLANIRESIQRRQREVDEKEALLEKSRSEFQSAFVSYKELQDENAIVKQDLRNTYAHIRKIQLDRDLQRDAQHSLDARVKELGGRYLKDNVKWIGSALTANNFTACKQRLLEVIARCRAIGLDISIEQESELVEDLRHSFEMAVRAAFQREEQARIKAQIREEQQREKEIERELKKLDRERDAVTAALNLALTNATELHAEEVEKLTARLAELEEKSQRTMSQAQLTRSGHVYVISNIGSFGESIYKIGMTRRFDPIMRIKELGDASVPFPFDVHLMIASDDAPTLEAELHRKLHERRINKINLRKEFFKTDLETLATIVRECHGEIQYVVDAEALEFRQSLNMPEDDQEFIESVYDELGLDQA